MASMPAPDQTFKSWLKKSQAQFHVSIRESQEQLRGADGTFEGYVTSVCIEVDNAFYYYHSSNRVKDMIVSALRDILNDRKRNIAHIHIMKKGSMADGNEDDLSDDSNDDDSKEEDIAGANGEANPSQDQELTAEKSDPVQQLQGDRGTISENPQDLAFSDKINLVASDFWKSLMSNLKDDDKIDLLFETDHEENKQIRLIDARDMVYTLSLDLSIFVLRYGQRENDPDTYYRILECDKTSKTQEQKPRNAGKKTADASDPLLNGPCFYPLGWLSEIRKSNADEIVSSQRLTKYVIGLNVSTDPISLWLIYDYTHPDEEFGAFCSVENGLTDLDLYHDRDPMQDIDESDVSVNPSHLVHLGYEFDA